MSEQAGCFGSSSAALGLVVGVDVFGTAIIVALARSPSSAESIASGTEPRSALDPLVRHDAAVGREIAEPAPVSFPILALTATRPAVHRRICYDLRMVDRAEERSWDERVFDLRLGVDSTIVRANFRLTPAERSKSTALTT